MLTVFIPVHYQNNIKTYPTFQRYLRDYQPPLLAIWGKNAPSFIFPGAQAILRTFS